MSQHWTILTGKNISYCQTETHTLIPSYSALHAARGSTSTFCLLTCNQRHWGAWTVPRFPMQGRWEKYGFIWVNLHQSSSSPLDRQVENYSPGVNHLKFRPHLKVSSCKLSSLRAVMVHFGLRLPSPSYNWWVEEKKKCYMQHIYLFIDSELYFFGLFLRALLWNNWLLKDSVLRDYIHLIQLPVGFQWEQNWILMQQMGLKSSFPF